MFVVVVVVIIIVINKLVYCKGSSAVGVVYTTLWYRECVKFKVACLVRQSQFGYVPVVFGR